MLFLLLCVCVWVYVQVGSVLVCVFVCVRARVYKVASRRGDQGVAMGFAREAAQVAMEGSGV